MNSLQYGDVTLDGVSCRGYNRQAICQGPDYLYTVYELHLRGQYNWKWPNSGQANQDLDPPNFDQSIRHDLMQMRQPFKMYINGAPGGGGVGNIEELWLQTDGQDAQLGAIPLYANVVQIVGTKTWMVDVGFKVHINECDDNGENPSVLLSNRWDMNQVIDQQSYSANQVAGRAVFRPDLLAKRNLTADQLRQWLLLPVPGGYKREQLSVTQSQDGAAIRYQFTDLQKSLQVGDGNAGQYITDVEIYMNLGTAHKGYEALAFEAAGKAQHIGNSITGLKGGDLVGGIASFGKYISPAMLAGGPLGPLLDGASRAFSKIAGGSQNPHLKSAATMAALSSTSISEVPETQYSTKIVVYGRPDAPLGTLVHRAIQIMASRMPFSTPSLYGTAANLSINHHRKIITLDYSVHLGPAALLAGAFVDLARLTGQTMSPAELNSKLNDIENSVSPQALKAIDGSSKFFTDLPKTVKGFDDDLILSMPDANQVGNGPTTANYPKPNSVRASSPRYLLTAALLGPCGVPENARGVQGKAAKDTADDEIVTPTGAG